MAWTSKMPDVRKSIGVIKPWDRKEIYDSIIKEANISPTMANKITDLVELELRRLKIEKNVEWLSGEMIRVLVERELINQGFEKERKLYSRTGMPLYDLEQLYFNYNWENSNQHPAPEFIHKSMADQMSRQYALMKLFNQDVTTSTGSTYNLSDAHMGGVIHIHDLDYLDRPFCNQIAGRYVFRNGLYIDGTGHFSNVSSPPKHLDTAIKLACEFLAACSRNWNGGQAWRNIAWELGPFIEKAAKTSSRTKRVNGMDIPANIVQGAQTLRYEPNHILVSRGSQAAFSTSYFQVKPPKYLREADVVLPGGDVERGSSYEQYAKYVYMFMHAYLMESIKGDYSGKMFDWMKDDISMDTSLRNDSEINEYIYEPTMQYIAKFGGPYLLNGKNVGDDEVECSSCCSLVIRSKDPEDFDLAAKGVLQQGGFSCTTLNLPRIAYDARGDDDLFFELLRERMELMKEAHIIRREFFRKVMESGATPFLMQPRIRSGPEKDLTPFFDVDKQSLLIGMVGLNEALQKHIGQEIHDSPEAHRFGLLAIKKMIDMAAEFSEETGAPFAVWRTPAETTATRLAGIDNELYGNEAIVQGDRKTGAVYYTNSTHLRVSAEVPLFKRILMESSFHALLGSNLLHVWLGEGNPDPDAIWSLTEKIINQTAAEYFTYTKEISTCYSCFSSFSGIIDRCPNCGQDGSNIYVQSRITGYMSTVGTAKDLIALKNRNMRALSELHWNKGKSMEMIARHRTPNLA